MLLHLSSSIYAVSYRNSEGQTRVLCEHICVWTGRKGGGLLTCCISTLCHTVHGAIPPWKEWMWCFCGPQGHSYHRAVKQTSLLSRRSWSDLKVRRECYVSTSCDWTGRRKRGGGCCWVVAWVFTFTEGSKGSVLTKVTMHDFFFLQRGNVATTATTSRKQNKLIGQTWRNCHGKMRDKV